MAKKDPLDRIAEQCLVARVRILNRQLTRIYDDALRPLKVKANQTGILVVIARRGPCTPGDVGAILHMEKSTVSRNLELMLKQGWLASLPGDDQRSHRVRITAKGKKLLERVLPRWEEAQQRAKALLGPTGAEALRKMVKIGP
jgi:DNA-binding MarR family transcriptional regulator